jgi:hypothetical protein
MDAQAETDQIAELKASGLFDRGWYRSNNPDVTKARLDTLVHYVRFGARERRCPNRYFDPAWYLTEYPDIARSGQDPLLHYIRYGDAEGRCPHPFFDTNWYRAAYGLPRDTPALRHFLAARKTGRCIPCAALYAVPRLAPYSQDAKAGIDPFAHYLDDMAVAQQDPFPDLAIVAASGLVDANYYLINASDVQEADLESTAHYCHYGWQENRRPNIYFDVGWYTQTNPDLARLKVNPVVHYILEGEKLNRRPVPYFDPGWYRETYRLPPEQNALSHYLAHRRRQSFSPNPLFDVSWYVAKHANEIGPHRDPFAHFLQAGTVGDVDPSPDFDAGAYRRRHLGRASRGFRHLMRPDADNPLVHHLRAEYLRLIQASQPIQRIQDVPANQRKNRRRQVAAPKL